MTGGTALAKTINTNLARACNEFGMGMGLGSCRMLLENEAHFADFDMRDIIGDDLPFYANIGIAQLEQMLENKSHALMMSSKSSPIFLKPESLSIIAAIRNFRTTSGISVGFTIDAGPNIHLLYHEDNEVVVKAFVESVLKRYCEKEMVIYDRCGAGPERIL